MIRRILPLLALVYSLSLCAANSLTFLAIDYGEAPVFAPDADLLTIYAIPSEAEAHRACESIRHLYPHAQIRQSEGAYNVIGTKTDRVSIESIEENGQPLFVEFSMTDESHAFLRLYICDTQAPPLLEAIAEDAPFPLSLVCTKQTIAKGAAVATALPHVYASSMVLGDSEVCTSYPIKLSTHPNSSRAIRPSFSSAAKEVKEAAGDFLEASADEVRRQREKAQRQADRLKKHWEEAKAHADKLKGRAKERAEQYAERLKERWEKAQSDVDNQVKKAREEAAQALQPN